MSKKYVIANFKMNKLDAEVGNYVDALKEKVKDMDLEIILSVPFVSIKTAVWHAQDSNISIAGQNLNENDFGAFTGEINAEMLCAVGANAVLVGHSERRNHFKETDVVINKKIMKGLRSGLLSVLCVGETLFDKKNNLTTQVLQKQITESLNSIYANELSHIVIAYEPVWAIGTGVIASKEEISNAIKTIRSLLADLYDEKIASEIKVIYGGSINEKNVKDISSISNIDGVLVGGASLDVDKFYKIACAFNTEKKTKKKTKSEQKSK